MFKGLFKKKKKVSWRQREDRIISRVVAKVESDTEKIVRTALSRSRYSYDVSHLAKLTASLDSAEYYAGHLLAAVHHSDRERMLDAAAKRCSGNGLILEFGVATGRSINRLAEHFPSQTIYGFDSFEGLPETWQPNFQKGAFAQKVPEVSSNVNLHVGWFDVTLPSFVEQHANEKVAFLHVDCDLYSSTKTIFQNLRGMIQPGCLILFDEYFNYPGWRGHEFKAFQEFIGENNLQYRYLDVVPSHNQVCIEIL